MFTVDEDAPAAPPKPQPATFSVDEPEPTQFTIDSRSNESATQPDRLTSQGGRGGYSVTLSKTWHKNVQDLATDLDEMVGAPTVWGKVWGGVKAAGGAFAIPYTPVEAGITETLGKGVEAATGGKFKAETVGEIGSIGSMFVLDPIGAAGAVTRGIRGTRTISDFERAISPGTISREAEETARVLTATETDMATTLWRD